MATSLDHRSLLATCAGNRLPSRLGPGRGSSLGSSEDMHDNRSAEAPAPAPSLAGRQHEKICAIRGLGLHLPDEHLTNADLEKIVDTSDEWIRQRTGIHSRRRLPDDETTSHLAARAASSALEDAGMSKAEIDLILVATCTPDMILPSTACRTQALLGMEGVTAMDISAACSGFGYAMSLAGGMVKAGLNKNVLVIGAEAMTRFLDYTRRDVCVLFGDGAGAAVVGAEGRFEMLYTRSGADGSQGEMITIPGGGAVYPASPETLEKRLHFVHLDGRAVFRSAVRQMAECARKAVDALGITVADISWVVPHQANERIILALAEALDLPAERVIVDLQDTGNTTAASIPVAFTRAARADRFKAGELIMSVAFGAGLTWSCQVYRCQS